MKDEISVAPLSESCTSVVGNGLPKGSLCVESLNFQYVKRRAHAVLRSLGLPKIAAQCLRLERLVKQIPMPSYSPDTA
jgi:hypothetical protein